MPDLRKNLQVRQPTNQGDDVNDGNGWPTPLTDPSSPLKMVVTSGGNGTQTNKDLISTSQQDAGEHQLSEGQGSVSKGDYLDQGGHGDKLKTSQQNAGDHSVTEG